MLQVHLEVVDIQFTRLPQIRKNRSRVVQLFCDASLRISSTSVFNFWKGVTDRIIDDIDDICCALPTLLFDVPLLDCSQMLRLRSQDVHFSVAVVATVASTAAAAAAHVDFIVLHWSSLAAVPDRSASSGPFFLHSLETRSRVSRLLLYCAQGRGTLLTTLIATQSVRITSSCPTPRARDPGLHRPPSHALGLNSSGQPMCQ